MNDPFQSALITYLAGIDASLKTIAAYAQHRLTQETGVKEVRVTAYVRGRNAGGDLVHLYSDHPKVTKRVGRVYSENFAALPFDPSQGKLHESEQAPSRDWAAANGYLNPVAPFTAIFAPTGKNTDAGKPIYRFSRIVSAPTPSVHPSQPADTPTPTPSTPSAQPASRHSPAESRQPVVRILRIPPLPPDTLRTWIQQSIADYTTQHRTATPAQTAHVHTALASIIPDEAGRRRFQEWLVGYPSMKEWSSAQILAVHGWLKPAPKNGPTDPHAADEIAQALDYLRDYAPHPT